MNHNVSRYRELVEDWKASYPPATAELGEKILKSFQTLDENGEFGGALFGDAVDRAAVYTWAMAFRRGELPAERKTRCDERFARRLGWLEKEYGGIEAGTVQPNMEPPFLYAHSLCASLPAEVSDFHHEEGTPIDWLPSFQGLRQPGIYDPVIHLALSHMALHDGGAIPSESVETMGAIGHRGFVPLLKRMFLCKSGLGPWRLSYNWGVHDCALAYITGALLSIGGSVEGQDSASVYSFLDEHRAALRKDPSIMTRPQLVERLDTALLGAGLAGFGL